MIDLNQIVGELTAKGVAAEFIAERVTSTPRGADPFAESQLNIMAFFTQLERAILLQGPACDSSDRSDGVIAWTGTRRERHR